VAAAHDGRQRSPIQFLPRLMQDAGGTRVRKAAGDGRWAAGDGGGEGPTRAVARMAARAAARAILENPSAACSGLGLVFFLFCFGSLSFQWESTRGGTHL
jgi:hypothetical protein